jgi:hypothetical protein
MRNTIPQDDFLKAARNGKGHYAIAYAVLEVASQMERLATEAGGIAQMIDRSGGEIQFRLSCLSDAISSGCDILATALAEARPDGGAQDPRNEG